MKHYYQIKVRMPGSDHYDWEISTFHLRPKRWSSLLAAKRWVQHMKARVYAEHLRRSKYRIFRITEQEIKQ
jgi:hypothetical protein